MPVHYVSWYKECIIYVWAGYKGQLNYKIIDLAMVIKLNDMRSVVITRNSVFTIHVICKQIMYKLLGCVTKNK